MSSMPKAQSPSCSSSGRGDPELKAHHLLRPKAASQSRQARGTSRELLAQHIDRAAARFAAGATAWCPGPSRHWPPEAEVAEDEGIVEDDVGDDGDDADRVGAAALPTERSAASRGTTTAVQRINGAGDHQELVGQGTQFRGSWLAKPSTARREHR